jgi:TonB family protein
MMKRNWLLLVAALIVAGCKKSDSGAAGSFQTVGRPPDVAPVMLNKDLPFRYPPALFAQKVQGNVTLRIFIDRTGQVIPESTHVAETSGYSALDSAAVKGSRDLRFAPAKTQDQPVPVSILLPIFFRYPGAPPLPGDTILKSVQTASSTPPLVDSSAAPADTPIKKKVTATKKPTRKRRR